MSLSLPKEIHAEIERQAKVDERSVPVWLRRYLVKQFPTTGPNGERGARVGGEDIGSAPAPDAGP